MPMHVNIYLPFFRCEDHFYNIYLLKKFNTCLGYIDFEPECIVAGRVGKFPSNRLDEVG